MFFVLPICSGKSVSHNGALKSSQDWIMFCIQTTMVLGTSLTLKSHLMLTFQDFRFSSPDAHIFHVFFRVALLLPGSFNIHFFGHDAWFFLHGFPMFSSSVAAKARGNWRARSNWLPTAVPMSPPSRMSLVDCVVPRGRPRMAPTPWDLGATTGQPGM